ncbi:cytochrome o ubiquinol oxidase subunit IV [Bartonella sp. DGB1]|uniref:cytochrome o ubiquinol oxidase subunit IV n=1 Tax=Bartonella sp. DGB1 TaxID=3239807 RepID=UPI003524969F
MSLVNEQGEHHHHEHVPKYSEYIIGFILSVILTLVAFFAVMNEWFTPVPTFFFIFGLAILQMVVQILYFLHLGQSEDSRWNYGMLIFAAVLIFIVIGGSIWIIFNLNYNVMFWIPDEQPLPLPEFVENLYKNN